MGGIIQLIFKEMTRYNAVFHQYIPMGCMPTVDKKIRKSECGYDDTYKVICFSKFYHFQIPRRR